ncbi:MAG: hypothetical protein ACLRIL_10455 [Fusicatenibacter saccharivorans]
MMSQKRSRIKINTDLAKSDRLEKSAGSAEMSCLSSLQKRGFEYEVHVGYLYQEEITREKAQQIADGLKECGLAQFVHDFYVYDVDAEDSCKRK